jgi:hypothetical protein
MALSLISSHKLNFISFSRSRMTKFGQMEVRQLCFRIWKPGECKERQVGITGARSFM